MILLNPNFIIYNHKFLNKKLFTKNNKDTEVNLN